MKYLTVLVGIVCVFLIHGVYTDDEMEIVSDEIDYINKKIYETLMHYTEKPASNFMLTLVYNESYKRLANSIVQKPAKKSDCKKAEEALHRFLMVAKKYDNIILQMEQAINYLDKIQQSSDDSMHLKYISLKIETLLHFSTSIFDAKEALRKYHNFRHETMSASDETEDDKDDDEQDDKDDDEEKYNEKSAE